LFASSSSWQRLRKTSSDWSASSAKEQNRRWLQHSCNLTGEAILTTGVLTTKTTFLSDMPFSTPTPVNNGNLWHTPKMLTASGASSLLSEELTRIRGSTLREKLSTLPCRVARSQGPRARPISYFLCHCLFVDRAERLGDVENRAKPVEVAHGPPTRRRRRTPTSVE